MTGSSCGGHSFKFKNKSPVKIDFNEKEISNIKGEKLMSIIKVPFLG